MARAGLAAAGEAVFVAGSAVTVVAGVTCVPASDMSAADVLHSRSRVGAWWEQCEK